MQGYFSKVKLQFSYRYFPFKWGKSLKKGVGGGEAACDYSAVSSVIISIFRNVTKEGKLLRRETCEISG